MRLIDYTRKLDLLYSQAHRLFLSGKIEGVYRDAEGRMYVPEATFERDMRIVERGAMHGLPSYTALTRVRSLLVEELSR